MPKLSFRMQKQLTHVWCWAAVSVSVDHFFDRNSEWRQCGIARVITRRRVCCGHPIPRRCVTPARLEEALNRLGRLKSPPTAGRLTFRQIQHRINEGHPVCLRIQWKDGGGHFVAISGYREHKGVRQVDVEDPLRNGTTTVNYTEFVRRYRGLGHWTHTYPV